MTVTCECCLCFSKSSFQCLKMRKQTQHMVQFYPGEKEALIHMVQFYPGEEEALTTRGSVLSR